MHPIQSRSQRYKVPSSSSNTIERLVKSLESTRPTLCREIGTAIWRWSLHIANTISVRNGQLISREISYPSYHVARRYLDPRSQHNCTLYHLDLLNIDKNMFAYTSVDWVFIDCHASLYQSIASYLFPLCSTRTVLLFDDMQTAAYKCPWLQWFFEKHWRYTQQLPSEWSDRLLVACKNATIIEQMTHQIV